MRRGELHRISVPPMQLSKAEAAEIDRAYYIVLPQFLETLKKDEYDLLFNWGKKASDKEIAEKLGISLAAAKGRVRQLVQIVHKRLAIPVLELWWADRHIRTHTLQQCIGVFHKTSLYLSRNVCGYTKEGCSVLY